MATKKTTKVPDGRGGWVEEEVEVRAGAKADPAKLQAAQARTFIDEAATLTERLLNLDMIYLREKGLTKEHRAFAAALYCINLRETYPDGADAFDAIAADAAQYYDDNKDKV